MKIFLFVVLILPTLVQANCVRDFTRCSAENKFQNIYNLETTRCHTSTGDITESTVLQIFNHLVSSCGPIPGEGCLKPIAERELNTYRHMFFQADIKFVGKHVFLKMDDRRVLHQGEFHLSTPKNDYMLLDGYTCVMNGK